MQQRGAHSQVAWEGFRAVLRGQAVQSDHMGHILAVCPRASCLPSLSFSFFICKMGLLIMPLVSDCCREE